MKFNMLKTFAVMALLGLAVPAFAADQDQGASGSSSSSTSGSSQQAQKKGVQASKLKGTQVSTKSGDSLGTVEEIVIDPDSGMVQFVILDAGAAAGGGENYKAVPWQAFKASKSGQNLTLNTDKQKFLSSPNIPKDHFADQTPDSVAVIYQIYQVQPPTAVGGTSSGSSTEQGKGSSSSSSSPSSSSSSTSPSNSSSSSDSSSSPDKSSSSDKLQ